MYYNADNLLSRHYTLNMICGDRNAGKSTCFQRYAIKRAIKFYNNSKGGSQFAILTRYDKDKKILCDTYFNNTMEMFYKDYELVYKRKLFYLRHKKSKKQVIVGYAFALNEATKLKSTSYPHIDTIIFEEFLNIENKYIKTKENAELEVELLISLYSTIARGNGKQVRYDVKLFLISNCYNINNPYFTYFDFVNDIVKDPFKTFYAKNNGKVKALIEMTHNDIYLDFVKKSINKGNKFTDLQNEIKVVKNAGVKDNKIFMQITLDNENYISIAPYNDNYIVLKTPELKNVIKFTCSAIMKKGLYDFGTFKRNNEFKSLQMAFNNNMLYFDNYNTFLTFYNIMNY